NLSTTFFEENHKLIRRSSLQGLTRDNPGKPPPTTHKSTNSQSIFISNSRTHQTAAAGAAALVVALYRPHLTKLSTPNSNFSNFLFHRRNLIILRFVK
ncbi:hypothetical protein, partial [Brucella melitensis]